MKVIGCNIRTSDAPDGADHWDRRSSLCCETIRQQDADVIACQEVTDRQLADLLAAFSDYDAYVLRDGTERDQPGNVTFYRRAGLQLRSSGGYWLSRTPHIAGSRGWGALSVAPVTWVRLRDRISGKDFRVLNGHLDVAGDFTRFSQVRVINEEVESFDAEYPQVLIGDLNAYPKSAPIQSLLGAGWQDAWPQVHGDLPSGHTYHGYVGEAFLLPEPAGSDRQPGPGDRIDYVMVRGAIVATTAIVVKDTGINGRLPSDHYFMSAELALG